MQENKTSFVAPQRCALPLPPKSTARAGWVSFLSYLRLFRRDILSAQQGTFIAPGWPKCARRVLVLSIPLGGSASAQGNSKGKGKGKSESTDRGKSDKFDGTLWEGFPDDQNRNQNGNSKNARKDDKNNGSKWFKGLSKRTGYSQSTLQSRYEIERRLNPDLTYGQFVAAHMIAKNNKKVSTGDILNGLRNGKSIGQTLKERSWDKNKVDKERKRIRDIFKDDRDYDDRDPDWLF